MSKELLDAKLALEQKTRAHIDDLINERAEFQKSTADRLKEIAGELKALGWKAARVKKAAGEPTTGVPLEQEPFDIRG